MKTKPHIYSIEDVRNMIFHEVKRLGSQQAFADTVGISQQYVSDILAGQRDPGKTVLRAMGLQRVNIYQPILTKL